jgi:ribonuclease P/MRP protein subunit RPP40
MEKIINEKLKEKLEGGFLSSKQHGFREARSCVTNLLTHMEEVIDHVDKKEPVDVVYFDFSKAFDVVPHDKLLLKLEGAGVGGKLLEWIGDWLKERTMAVVLNGHSSKTLSVTSGAPQGSVLGPTLFLVYINDLPSVVDCPMSIFADDTKIYQVIKTEDDKQRLQANIDAMRRWSLEWGMPFNDKKSAVVHFGRNNPNFSYLLGDKIVRPTTTQKDLGVVIDSQGKYTNHISEVAKKCNRITGMIKTRFKSRDPNLLSQLYKVYILPIIGYASEVWAPTYKIQLEFLEKIQKRYCRLTGSKSYSGSCKALSLITVEDFLKNKDLKYMHKILSNNTCLNFNDFFKTSDSGKTRSSTEAKINLPKARSNIKKHSFSSRSIKNWNEIPREIRFSDAKCFDQYISKL